MKIIIVGKAGSGKDFLKNKLVERGFSREVSYATRPPRPGERPGVDYNFIDEIGFLRLKEEGFFYECQNFNGWWYGTSVKEFYTKSVFIFTPSGVKDIKSYDRKNCFIIFLDVSEGVRRERLALRNDADKTERRIAADEEDFRDFKDFDIRITNPDF